MVVLLRFSSSLLLAGILGTRHGGQEHSQRGCDQVCGGEDVEGKRKTKAGRMMFPLSFPPLCLSLSLFPNHTKHFRRFASFIAIVRKSGVNAHQGG